MSVNKKIIAVRGATEHNLKSIDVDIIKDTLTVITGVSGSGKSSLAYYVIAEEAARRYFGSLSSHATRYFEISNKPSVESIDGLSPPISLDQRVSAKNPRSTLATTTEIYDYLRVFFAKIGVPYSPMTGLPLEQQTPEAIASMVIKTYSGANVLVVAQVVYDKKGDHKREIIDLRKKGVLNLRINDVIHSFDGMPLLDREKRYTIDAIICEIFVNEESKVILKEKISQAFKFGNGAINIELVNVGKCENNINGSDEAQQQKSVVTISADHKIPQKTTFVSRLICPISGFTLPPIEPRLFSFNSPHGACNTCNGLGVYDDFIPELLINSDLTINDGAILPWNRKSNKSLSLIQQKTFEKILFALAKNYDFSLDILYKYLPEHIKDIIMYGVKDDSPLMLKNSDAFIKQETQIKFEGILRYVEQRWKSADNASLSEGLRLYRDTVQCKTCGGYKLRKEALCIKIDGKHIGEMCAMSVGEAAKWITSLEDALTVNQKIIVSKIIVEIRRRLDFLSNIGVGYLTLDRRSSTLSGGEMQRVRLATQIGSGLSGIIYVLDEPSIGLHQADNDKLLTMLCMLRDLGNTIIVVEHDDDTMRHADYIVDIGIGAGVYGGNVVANGTIAEIIACKDSITGKYLSGEFDIELPKKRRVAKLDYSVTVFGASVHNLKNIDVNVPLGLFIAVTGVSGSGKSSFIIDILYKAAAQQIHHAHDFPGAHTQIIGLEHIDKVVEVDQSPIGRTPRANSITYIKVFSIIRDWFADTPMAKSRGYDAGRFSFNVRGGRCPVCEGDGVIKIEMHFLPDVYLPCEECNGRRYNSETLEVKYRDKSIADVLEMTTDVAVEFFVDVPQIQEKLIALQEVGLGYMQLGQSATTLSGGEAQRVKLAKELARKSTGNTLYLMDEPTTGLHKHDVKKLLNVLHRLVDMGNTVIVIEHNLDLIKTADYIIDFGPFGGKDGGLVIASGTPEEVAATENSLTGKYLKDKLIRK